jgi:hypothetical protein
MQLDTRVFTRVSMTPWAICSRTNIARHITGCRLTRYTCRVHMHVDDVVNNINIWLGRMARHIIGRRFTRYMSRVHMHIDDVVSNFRLAPAWSTTTRAVWTR